MISIANRSLQKSNIKVIRIAAAIVVAASVSACVAPVKPGRSARPAKVETPKTVLELAKSHRPHLAILKKFGRCLARPGNRGRLKSALKNRQSLLARRIQNSCISKRELTVLQTGPMTTDGGRPTVGPPTRYYKSISYGFGPSAAAYFGIGVDAGWTWNLNNYGPTRPYLTGSAGTGWQLNVGADPIIVGVYRAAVSPGVFRSSAITGSFEAGIGVTLGLYFDRGWIGGPSDKYQGFMVAVGAGIGGNLKSKFKVRTRIFRVNCRAVNVIVTNNTGGKVKIIDLDYHDYTKGKWRSKPTRNRQVADGGVWRKTQQLGKVGSEDTQIRIKYRKRTRGFKKWGKTKRGWSNRAFCEKGATFRVSLKR